MAKKRHEKEFQKEDPSSVNEINMIPVRNPIQRQKKVKKPVHPPQKEAGKVVPLRVFVTLAGKKWDQLAGFEHYAKKQGFGPKSVVEWQKELKSFHNKPVR